MLLYVEDDISIMFTVDKDGERQSRLCLSGLHGAIYCCLKGEFIAAVRKGHNRPTTDMAVRDMTRYDSSM